MSDTENPNYNDGLEEYVKDFKIFVDTCSFLYSQDDNFWIRLVDLLSIHKRFIFIPVSVANELKKVANSKNSSDEVRNLARKRLLMINQMLDHDLVKIYGTGNDTFSDNIFQAAFMHYRIKYKLLLITQDNDLAKDILRINENLSTQANKVEAKRIGSNGELRGYGWEKSKTEGRRKFSFDDTDEIAPFRICQNVTAISNALITNTLETKTGSRLFTPRAEMIILGEEIASGGEGIIYKTNTDYVAKIYKPDHLTIRRREKLKLMLSRPIKYEGVCWPVSDLYNERKEFVGFLMPLAKGKEIQRSIFLPPLFKKIFPDWKKRDTVELCVTILRKIAYLHSHNIIIGDINPANILVVSPKEVFFVDVDSWQIEDFPCPVGTINYTAPEIQRKNFDSFLRTIGNENFALATLLFMIMLPGKTPYAQQGGEDPITNIINMDFSYPLGEATNRKTPDGMWRFMWSHLTFKVKERFYQTFRKGESHAAENTRLNAKMWLALFVAYLNLLDNGKMAEQDKMSEEIFPTRFKMSKDKNYVKCMFCDEMILEESNRKVCRKCGDKVVYEHRCECCGKEMVFSYHEKYNLGLKHGYSYCSDCRSKIQHKAFCTNCGKRFEMDGGEVDYYKTHDFDMPKLCPECRKKNHEIVKCPICGRSVEFGKTVEGFCRDCLDKDLIPPYRCENCYTTIRFTNYDKYILKRTAPYTLCKKCYEEKQQNKNRSAHGAYCTECGEYFTMTNGEVEFYQSRGLDLPKRCPKCRGTSKTERRPQSTVGKSIFGSFFK
ncbi:MAG: zinc-ribbon domain containing protein [Selenomonadaceae bacterium]|nr:zinc-ribbon domain containing protein [Selenomonadaceae bacterium]